MKKKNPRLPDPKRPQLWAAYDDETRMRLRILYPSGKAEYMYFTDGLMKYESLDYLATWMIPCWIYQNFPDEIMDNVPMTRMQKLMKEYDKRQCRKTYFLYNI